MEKSKEIKNVFKGIITVFGVMFLETIIHFTILLMIKGIYYNAWDNLFTYYKNTGTSPIEDFAYDALSILGLRLVFGEFIFRILVQLSEVRIELKLLVFLLISLIYTMGFSTLFFGLGFSWRDFFFLSFGWYFHLPLSVFIVCIMRWVIVKARR